MAKFNLQYPWLNYKLCKQLEIYTWECYEIRFVEAIIGKFLFQFSVIHVWSRQEIVDEGGVGTDQAVAAAEVDWIAVDQPNLPNSTTNQIETMGLCKIQAHY